MVKVVVNAYQIPLPGLVLSMLCAATTSFYRKNQSPERWSNLSQTLQVPVVEIESDFFAKFCRTHHLGMFFFERGSFWLSFPFPTFHWLDWVFFSGFKSSAFYFYSYGGCSLFQPIVIFTVSCSVLKFFNVLIFPEPDKWLSMPSCRFVLFPHHYCTSHADCNSGGKSWAK